MPEPAIIVGPDERAAAANGPALELLPGLRVGDPFVLGLRAPDVIDARRRVMASGEAETVQWSERVPVERLFEVCRLAGVSPTLSDQIEVEVWSKFVHLSVLSGMTSVTRSPVGPLRDDPDLFAMWQAALVETIAVARALSRSEG
jgi:ketopantoate reductase